MSVSSRHKFRCLCFICIVLTLCLLIRTRNRSQPHKYGDDTNNADDPKSNQILVQKDEIKQNRTQVPDDEEKIDRNRNFTDQQSVQVERHRILRQACLKYPGLSKGQLSAKTKQQILVNEKQKLLYCFIPKVGCSNWKRVMMKLTGKTNKKLLEITSLEAHNSNGLRTLNNYNYERQKQMLTSFTKFVYVRNPFLRFLSAYKNKFEDIDRYRKRPVFHTFGKEIIRKYRKNPTMEALKTGENATWMEFVQYVTDPIGNPIEDHWEQMNTLCSPCKVRYNFIGHLETMEADAHYMLQMLNLSDQVQYPSAKRSHPTNSTASFEAMFRKLDAQQLERLWNIYKTDFELFGYPKPNFL